MSNRIRRSPSSGWVSSYLGVAAAIFLYKVDLSIPNLAAILDIGYGADQHGFLAGAAAGSGRAPVVCAVCNFPLLVVSLPLGGVGLASRRKLADRMPSLRISLGLNFVPS